MKKTVYSLVLSDDIVSMVDRLAYRAGTNRSNMINQILAEYVSYITPEKRIREVFDHINGILYPVESLRMVASTTDTVMTLQSALIYKYNPTVRYAVELYRDSRDALGEMRVSLRTQNTVLLDLLENFFDMWQRIETSYVGECTYEKKNGRFVRVFRLRRGEGGQGRAFTSDLIADSIAQYIRIFDSALKYYFENATAPDRAYSGVEHIYADYLRAAQVMI